MGYLTSLPNQLFESTKCHKHKCAVQVLVFSLKEFIVCSYDPYTLTVALLFKKKKKKDLFSVSSHNHNKTTYICKQVS